MLQNELPPWITRLRIWDSIGSSMSSVKTTSPISITTQNNRQTGTSIGSVGGGGGSGVGVNGSGNIINNHNNTNSNNNYYYSPQNPIYGKNIKVNIDNVWNPVDTYVYGPTQNSIFNGNPDHKLNINSGGGGVGINSGSSSSSSQKFDKYNIGLSSVATATNPKETLNFMINRNEKIGSSTIGHNNRDSNSVTTVTLDGRQRHLGGGGSSSSTYSTSKMPKYSTSRKLIAEHYDNETPRLCDHSLLNDGENKMRPCSPLESYVSTSRDMVRYILFYFFVFFSIFIQ